MRSFLSAVLPFCLFTALGIQESSAQTASGHQASIQPAVKKLVDEICSDGGAWLRCYSLAPSRCKEITTGFVEPCVSGAMMTPVAEPAAQSVVRLLICFNQRFMAKYGFGEVKSPECKDPMKHLSKER